MNAAPGYYFRLFCRLAREELLKPPPDDLKIPALFPLYFKAIRYREEDMKMSHTQGCLSAACWALLP
jgi:hypothetical protein